MGFGSAWRAGAQIVASVGEVSLGFEGAGYEREASNYPGLISRRRCQPALPRTGNLWRCKLIT